jgi:hypothetical protein
MAPNASSTFVAASLREQVWRECVAMASHAYASGLAVPGPVASAIDGGPSSDGRDEPVPDRDLETLSWAHGQLVKIIAPASPRTVLLLARRSDSAGFWSPLGPVRLVRQMLAVAALSVVGFVAMGQSSEVTRTSGDLLASSGWTAVLNQLFVLCAASIGAAFAALFKARQFISQGTYDPKYESDYWVRYGLGLVAGLVLVDLVPQSSAQGAAVESLGHPLLALLGGFSAPIVYGLLERLAQAVESVVKGHSRELQAAQEQLTKAHSDARSGQERLVLIAALSELQRQLEAGASTQQLGAQLSRIVAPLLPASAAPVGAPAPPPTNGKVEVVAPALDNRELVGPTN